MYAEGIQGLVSQSALEETTAITSTVLISIDKASQTMTVSLDGVQATSHAYK